MKHADAGINLKALLCLSTTSQRIAYSVFSSFHHGLICHSFHGSYSLIARSLELNEYQSQMTKRQGNVANMLILGLQQSKTQRARYSIYGIK